MRLIRSLSSLNKEIFLPELCLTIGNFDGLHFGHLHVINQVKEIAKKENLASAIMTFEPHPAMFFKSDLRTNFRIFSLAQKIAAISQTKIDYLIILPFNRNFSSLSAEEFIKILHSRLNLRHLVIGYDFAFGQNRQGNFRSLENRGFKLTEIPPLKSSLLFSSAESSDENSANRNCEQTIGTNEKPGFFEEFLGSQICEKASLVGSPCSKANLDNRHKSEAIAIRSDKNQRFANKITKKMVFVEVTISSSTIRQSILDGKIEVLKQLSGRNFTVCGRVINGKKLARTLGFPTANIKALNGVIKPPFGVYESEVFIPDFKKTFPAIVNFGLKPTIEAQFEVQLELKEGLKLNQDLTKEPIYEAHLLNFNQETYGEIYGKKIFIELKKFVRPEQKFGSLQELKEQIEIDLRRFKQRL